jgi:hypothetical protein
VEAEEVSIHGRPYSLNITLPPLGVLFFTHPGSGEVEEPETEETKQPQRRERERAAEVRQAPIKPDAAADSQKAATSESTTKAETGSTTKSSASTPKAEASSDTSEKKSQKPDGSKGA